MNDAFVVSSKIRRAPTVPAPLDNALKAEEATIQTVPNDASLAVFLSKWGIDTSTWGQGNTKDVGKFWCEIKLDECGLEIWKRPDGTLQPVRVTHVLRAKVCSASSLERGTFLFNTWQQFGDGRKRTRNGLLSEKLCISEMPLEDHLEDVCRRAVTEEEMQRLVEAEFMLRSGDAPPAFDPSYSCPLTVTGANYIDHTIELENSKSYPGLLTMYHLYTVDIVCTGLPSVAFNTLEFDHEDENGNRPLKYIHAWVWLGWPQIQRYLLDGSDLKESKQKGSFKDVAAMEAWLGQFDLELTRWGKDSAKTSSDLFREVESDEAHLELWGRQDGVPLLMRVVHVLQIKVMSTDARLAGKFLLQASVQDHKGVVRPSNRLLSMKLSSAENLSDLQRFHKAAREAVSQQLSTQVDVHFRANPLGQLRKEEMHRVNTTVDSIVFVGHRIDVEQSPSYIGMHTMYHLYTMEMDCKDLPVADFVTLDFRPQGPWALSWRWTTWEETLDVLHGRLHAAERKDDTRKHALLKACEDLDERTKDIDHMLKVLSSADVNQALKSAHELQDKLLNLRANVRKEHALHEDTEQMFPPSMVAKMSMQTIADNEMLEQGRWEHQQSLKEHHKVNGACSSQSIAKVAGVEEPQSTTQRSKVEACLEQPSARSRSQNQGALSTWVLLALPLLLCAAQVAIGIVVLASEATDTMRTLGGTTLISGACAIAGSVSLHSACSQARR